MHQPPWQADPPLAGRPSGRQTPRQADPTPPWQADPHWQAEPPLAGRPPRQADPPCKVNARPVHILLECILVQDGFMMNVRVYYIGIATAL